MISRGHEILKEISSEKAKWEDYKEAMEAKMTLNMGNSILSAVMVVYASPMPIEVRKHLLNETKQILNQKEVTFDT